MNSSLRDDEQIRRKFQLTNADSVTCAIIDELTQLEGVTVEDLDPLYETIDPDVLERLFEPRGTPASLPMRELRFEYSGYLIMLSTDGDGLIVDSVQQESCQEE